MASILFPELLGFCDLSTILAKVDGEMWVSEWHFDCFFHACGTSNRWHPPFQRICRWICSGCRLRSLYAKAHIPATFLRGCVNSFDMFWPVSWRHGEWNSTNARVFVWSFGPQSNRRKRAEVQTLEVCWFIDDHRCSCAQGAWSSRNRVSQSFTAGEEVLVFSCFLQGSQILQAFLFDVCDDGRSLFLGRSSTEIQRALLSFAKLPLDTSSTSRRLTLCHIARWDRVTSKNTGRAGTGMMAGFCWFQSYGKNRRCYSHV